jgi:hypothetical protein
VQAKARFPFLLSAQRGLSALHHLTIGAARSPR